jgi:hypothetical protein
MQILLRGVNGDENTTPRMGVIDTQSDVSLVSQSILTELGYDYYPRDVGEIFGINQSFFPIGTVPLLWHVFGLPKEIYNTEFYIISEDMEPAFDFILGKQWIAETGALSRNPRGFTYLPELGLRKTALGKEHPNTPTSIENLAITGPRRRTPAGRQ